MERILEQNILDIFSYLSYMQSKIVAEKAQRKFLEDLERSRSKRR